MSLRRGVGDADDATELVSASMKREMVVRACRGTCTPTFLNCAANDREASSLPLPVRGVKGGRDEGCQRRSTDEGK